MKIYVNGQQREAREGLTVDGLVREMGIRREGAAIELNRQIVPKSRYGETALRPNDRLEVVTFVGGG